MSHASRLYVATINARSYSLCVNRMSAFVVRRFGQNCFVTFRDRANILHKDACEIFIAFYEAKHFWLLSS